MFSTAIGSALAPNSGGTGVVTCYPLLLAHTQGSASDLARFSWPNHSPNHGICPLGCGISPGPLSAGVKREECMHVYKQGGGTKGDYLEDLASNGLTCLNRMEIQLVRVRDRSVFLEESPGCMVFLLGVEGMLWDLEHSRIQIPPCPPPSFMNVHPGLFSKVSRSTDGLAYLGFTQSHLCLVGVDAPPLGFS